MCRGPAVTWLVPGMEPGMEPGWSHTVTGWRPGWRPGRGPAWSLALHHGGLRVNSAFEKWTEIELVLCIISAL